MKIFVFMWRSTKTGLYQILLLKMDQKVSEGKLIKDLRAAEVRDLINQIPTECIFVGMRLRDYVLKPLLHELRKSGLDLPDKLKFHWIPPYKLPFEDILWIYNFGMYGRPETDDKITLSDIVDGYQVLDDKLEDVEKLAISYFELIGDFNKV